MEGLNKLAKSRPANLSLMSNNECRCERKIKKEGSPKLPSLCSRDDKIRTCDHQTPSLVRYRTALRPEKNSEIPGGKSKP